MQNSLYLLGVLQYGELKSAKKLIFTVLFVIWRAQKCKIANIYCAFCNLESSKYKITYIYCAFCNSES